MNHLSKPNTRSVFPIIWVTVFVMGVQLVSCVHALDNLGCYYTFIQK